MLLNMFLKPGDIDRELFCVYLKALKPIFFLLEGDIGLESCVLYI